jgi:hypothetical protein
MIGVSRFRTEKTLSPSSEIALNRRLSETRDA